ncbi:phenylalanine--tRNA ligase subunit beta, partial [Candidatus Woesebacteria bacterium]|nr:phenylalanine--tRNA ligase subunit beta [Candidatus Woesebacteria bacterium]
MNILVPDNWLRVFLKTKATPKQIAEGLSLCGPSVEKVEERKTGPIYHIEITTNRVDAASIYGIAREAAAILPRFKFQAKLNPIKATNLNLSKKVDYLNVEVDPKLCLRFTAVLIRGVKIADSPNWLKERLESVGVRAINNVVDISNYIMHEIGQPVHTFDYDKIVGAKMVLRKSARGEKIKTLDGNEHTLSGGDIVIEDGGGKLIDLAGIMGGRNSAVEADTKNILLFVQTYNPVNIRRTSMSLAIRTEAAVLFEKALDTELVALGVSRGIDLFKELTGGSPEKKILDIYPSPYKKKYIKLDYHLLLKKLGLDLPRIEISKILESLGFESTSQGNSFSVSVPSFRSSDIETPEDISEEVARIYGYHNFPSTLMGGIIPEPLPNPPFSFEERLRSLISGWGGIETFTLSLVPGEWEERALKLKNPLGAESEYLRTSLLNSLVSAANQNSGTSEPFHLFEIANVYLPRKGDLPEEKMMLAGIFANEGFRKAKGLLEALGESVNIRVTFKQEDSKNFLPSHRLEIYSGTNYLGQFGQLEKKGYFYYELEIETL